MSGKRVLVTGATGFIGQHTVPVLEQMGYEIIQCSRRFDCDLLRNDHIKKKVEAAQASHLLHIAWDVSKGYKLNSASNMQWACQSISLISAFIKYGGRRVVIAGTQRNPETNKTPYGYWKNELNNHAMDICRKEQVSYAYGRIYNPYGIGEKPDRLVPYIINSLLDEKELEVSDKSIDIINSKDVADALCHILDSNLQGNVDIGTGRTIPIPQLCNVIQTLMKLPVSEQVASIEDRPADTAALDSIGWHPRYALEEGLQETIEWWWNQRWQQ